MLIFGKYMIPIIYTSFEFFRSRYAMAFENIRQKSPRKKYFRYSIGEKYMPAYPSDMVGEQIYIIKSNVP